MKEIEAYQTSDGKTFFKKEEAEGHESKLAVEAKKELVEQHLLELLGIQDYDDSGVIEEAEEFCQLMNECGSAVGDSGWNELIRIIIDIATASNGALLKTAQYTKKLMKGS